MTRQVTTSSSANTATRICVQSLVGTANVTDGSDVVTGSSTSFTNLHVGDDIIINNERKTIKRIDSDASLVVDSNYEADATAQSIEHLDRVFKGYNKIVAQVAHPDNTATVWSGEEINTTDISATKNTHPIAAGATVSPVVIYDMYNLMAVSSVANQKLSLIINQ